MNKTYFDKIILQNFQKLTIDYFAACFILVQFEYLQSMQSMQNVHIIYRVYPKKSVPLLLQGDTQ